MPKLGHILRELYDTEIEYVNSLGRTVHIYLNGLLKQPIVNIKIICYKIFGNIQDILHFHQDVFLPRLEEAYHSAGEVCLLCNIFGVFWIQKWLKFGNFWANLVEFRVEKGPFTFVTQFFTYMNIFLLSAFQITIFHIRVLSRSVLILLL